METFLVKIPLGWDLNQMRVPTAVVAISLVFIWQVYLKDYWSKKPEKTHEGPQTAKTLLNNFR